MNNIEYFYKTDEIDDFIDNWNKFYNSFLLYNQGNKQEYKWMILYLYMSFQSLLIITLITSNPYPVLKCKSHKKLSKIEKPYCFIFDFTLTPNSKIIFSKENYTVYIFPTFGSNSDLLLISNELNKIGYNLTLNELFNVIKEMKKLLPLKELYKRIKNPIYMKQYINSQPLLHSLYYDDEVNKLIEIRNDFIHFTPKSWLIDYGYFKTIIINIIKIMKFIISESNCVEDVFNKINNSNIVSEMQSIIGKD